MPRNKRHYHVVSGLGGGYSPNTSTPCTTKRDAQEYARDLAREWVDSQAWADLQPDERRKMHGSARKGLYVFVSDGPYDLGEYIEIMECDRPDCWCGSCGELLGYDELGPLCRDCDQDPDVS